MTIAQPLSGLSVLVIEDEFFIARDLACLAERLGANVSMTPSVPQALASIKDQTVDLAVIDVNLRGLIAIDVAEALAASSVPALVVTGYDREMVPAAFGAWPMISKPYTSLGFEAALRGVALDVRRSASRCEVSSAGSA